MRKTILVGLGLIAIIGCNNQPQQKEEPITQKSDALIAPGMLSPDYSPIKAGAIAKIVAYLGEGRSIENFRFAADGTIWATSLTSGELLHIFPDTGEVVGYPVDGLNPGTYLGGLAIAGDEVIFATAAIENPFVYNSSLMKFSLAEGFSLLADLPNAALNGVVEKDGFIYTVDALRPEGIVWRVPLAGGPATIWYQGPAGQADPNYVVTPCNPPFTMGFNGGQEGPRLLWDSLITSNTTTGVIAEIPIFPDGSAGDAVTWYDADTYPDDIAVDRCGLTRKGTFITTHGLHELIYENPFRPQDHVVVAKGADFDGPTSAAIRDGKLWIAKSADFLICRPDQDGNPDPTSCDPETHLCMPGAAAIVTLELDPAYVTMCTW